MAKEKKESRKKSRKEGTDESSDEEQDRKRHRKKKRHESKKEKKSKKRKRKDSSESSVSSASSTDTSESRKKSKSSHRKKLVNERLLAKLEARGETLEERNARRAQKRAAVISQKFGYTAESNPFNDPNLHEKFSWKKREVEQQSNSNAVIPKKSDATFYEIEKVRQRRKDRDLQREELERIRAEESRMKELENYDEWARKEEEFHLQQQRQRSAIRLVEGREKPIDILAKNLLLFGLSDDEKQNRASIKYQEKYNAIKALESLEAELEEPHNFVKVLKLQELEELRLDIDAFRQLEREARAEDMDGSGSDSILQYWNSLAVVVDDELNFIKSGGEGSNHDKLVADVKKIFEGQTKTDITKMKDDVKAKLRESGHEESERTYWLTVVEQLDVALCKAYLSETHSKMLVRQLEKLEKRRDELANEGEAKSIEEDLGESKTDQKSVSEQNTLVDGDLEEELGLSNEVDLDMKSYSWQEKYRPRKPRYFNRVKTGYDWNKYNQTHYDKDNPPPKTVQGYKFNIFYVDLIDPTKTPTFTLEPADSDEFCIIKFHGGAPYEDIAFKIINREWNKSRKRGFKCSFERGVLSLYFNFTTHWYRR